MKKRDDALNFDTLYEAPYGGGLPSPSDNAHNVVMSYYHGPAVPQGMVFSGFNFWFWKRTECKALIDFVLQRMWSIPPGGAAARSIRPTAASTRPPDAQASPIWLQRLRGGIGSGWHAKPAPAPPRR